MLTKTFDVWFAVEKTAAIKYLFTCLFISQCCYNQSNHEKYNSFREKNVQEPKCCFALYTLSSGQLTSCHLFLLWKKVSFVGKPLTIKHIEADKKLLQPKKEIANNLIFFTIRYRWYSKVICQWFVNEQLSECRVCASFLKFLANLGHALFTMWNKHILNLLYYS